MARDLTSNYTDAANAEVVFPAFFVQLDFSSVPLRIWSGTGTKSWDSSNWLGVGKLGAISPVQETQDIHATQVNLELSGIPAGELVAALTEDYQSRPATIYLNLMDSADAATANVVGSYPVFAGRIDQMIITDDADDSRIQVVVENNLIDLFRARDLRYTHEDQRNLFPDDDGLEYVAYIAGRPINWGVKENQVPTSDERIPRGPGDY